MAWRWAGTVLQEAQKRFNRIHGYREISLLVNALEKNIVANQDIA